MKLSYCKLSEGQKEFLHEKYNAPLEKFYFEKFKIAINNCFKIVASICIGISFSGLCMEGLFNVSNITELTSSLLLMVGKPAMTTLVTLWVLGYMACVGAKASVKDYLIEMGKLIATTITFIVSATMGGYFLWELIKLFV